MTWPTAAVVPHTTPTVVSTDPALHSPLGVDVAVGLAEGVSDAVAVLVLAPVGVADTVAVAEAVATGVGVGVGVALWCLCPPPQPTIDRPDSAATIDAN